LKASVNYYVNDPGNLIIPSMCHNTKLTTGIGWQVGNNGGNFNKRVKYDFPLLPALFNMQGVLYKTEKFL